MHAIHCRHFGPPPPAWRLPSGAVVPSNWHPPVHGADNTLRTCSGLLIGSNIKPRMPEITRDGMLYQAVALAGPRKPQGSFKSAFIALGMGLKNKQGVEA